MRWRNLDESNNVEDRRGQSSSYGGGGFRGLPVRGKAGVVMFLVVMVAGYYGVDLTPLLSGGDGVNMVSSQPHVSSAHEEELARFSAVTLKTTEDAWEQYFERSGKRYTPTKLVLYRGGTETGCGMGQAAMGPFYCPSDRNVYLDVAFFQEMKERLGGGGDFAQGYVIAHEVGHHVQHLLGIDQEVRRLQERSSEAGANHLSVKLELQADCFAGVWGHVMRQEGILEGGDLEEALNTAQAIGDDTLQRQSSGRVMPDSFTHGTSQQRYSWFKRGFDSGDPGLCDTFSAR